ncbi:hypothetical protein LTR17_006112 [Elasticomyces elasticus]|nr:hypothetical protein LTR17_006112 [Elasticomyces elasticus]
MFQIADAATQSSGADGPTMRVSLDYRTKNVASAILAVKPGEPVSDDIQTVHFGIHGAGDFWTPQLVAWDASGKSYWRHEVNLALDECKRNLKIVAMPVELFLSAPQMWKAPANITMTAAAKSAGTKHVELVYEPQSAAGYFVGNVKYRVPKYLGLGDVLLVADVGGGTGDFVSLGFESSSADGAKVRSTTVGTPIGKSAKFPSFCHCC